MAVFRISRYETGDEEPHYVSYDVPYQDGMRVLDALNYIHDNIDGTLAYRWVCRAGQCGSCGIRVNGMACLACQEEVDKTQDVITLDPLPLFPVIKDLIVDLDKGYDKLYAAEPYLKRSDDTTSQREIGDEAFQQLKTFRGCIECWCCVASCPVVNQIWDDYFGPIVMRKLCELDIDPRDLGERVELAVNEGLYNCTTCRNCWAVCPENIELPEKAVEKLRARAVREGKGPLEGHKQLVRSIDNYKNPWVMPRSRRAKWAKGLNIPSKGKLMFFAGCSPSLLLGDRLPYNIVVVLRRLGFEVAYLGKDEICCGSPLLKVGEEDLYRELAQNNIKLMQEKGVKTIVTTCAGCHKSWAVDYKEFFGDYGIEVRHVTEILWDAYKEGKFHFRDLEENNIRISYHDPCHLGRGSGIYDAPRNLIDAIPGMEFVETPRNRENSHCCGSGGGVKTAKPDVALKVGSERVHMFEKLDVKYVITCCPWCEQHIDDSIRYSDSDLGLTKDLIEIIEKTMEIDSDE